MNNQDPHIYENANTEQKNTVSGEHIRGIFLNRKFFKIIFIIIIFILVVIIFRKDLFGDREVEQEQVKKSETLSNKKTDNEVNYENIKDLENIKYGDENIADEDYDNPDYNVPAQEELSQEEQDRLNRIKQLEDEVVTALRSPTTITIASRPKVEESSTGSFLMQQNKPVTDYDGNRQESKKNFLMNEPAQRFYQENFLVAQLSEFELKAGDFIPATMITGINSDLPSKAVVAQVSENVFDSISGRNLLIPQGTKIIGTYDSSITFGQERLIIIWQRLIFPNGKTIGLDNMQGVDLSGQAGIDGLVDNHFSTLLKGVLLSSLLGSAASITVDKRDWRGAAADGAGQQIVAIGETFAEKALSRQPTIIIEKGTRFNITVHSDLILEPYNN
ncbi:MAG: TrbI/VirB10 family protein [Fusobacterium sp.]|uniref:TrbI/VirB10 family protein n=1 Tax=Fusobacterium sp. TaxID=68766 RepID=UPI0026DC910F|nr:TrbI/VirB10 family protein [Fusobacterium sp.]MDO4689829.1 TrbI/VirB10 family protein [Fusobacterium sp.]